MRRFSFFAAAGDSGASGRGDGPAPAGDPTRRETGFAGSAPGGPAAVDGEAVVGDRPLAGRVVVVTRAKHQGEHLVGRLQALGARAYHVPLICVSPLPLTDDLAAALKAARTADWLIFTSQNGVDAFFARYREAALPPLSPARPRRVAVGPKTAERLAAFGLPADVVAEEYTAEGVVEALAGRVAPGEQAVIVRGTLSRDVVAPALREYGLEVTSAVVYDNVRDEAGVRRLQALLQEAVVDVVTLTSPSIAEAVAEAVAGAGRGPRWYASIGPVTTGRARALGLAPVIEARPFTEEGLVAALVEAVRSGEAPGQPLP
ncbi:MAG: Uroporphyrinogen-III methyltransferase [Hydrogenibacillus schlegelii]|uniref:Uroporphyrinogen-III synthase n=1 Tax=Hydrogenibacillus schlegelii TaxID=1484 RepID=A0A2T5GB87_HYDSH|nr:uroporphyrinogen-III synthase [Hydrogenibacillus schlegelii]PTQ53446.1 MAG: Uroporphyrinogen-III methyltransferase [Hydrogenibacillus schlegelii]